MLEEMKQYCRYCGSCVYGDVPYCEVKDKVLTESYIKRENHCKTFEFCNIDVITGKEYAPRKHKTKVAEETLF